jgi:citrate lyase subunit beta / citryl-CoA lyase
MITLISDARSFLLVPGDQPHRVCDAAASAADAIMIDLEDSVAAANKTAARDAIGRQRRDHHASAATCVRINRLDTDQGRSDLATLAPLGLDAVVVPKATAATLAAVPTDTPPIIALIETSRGVRDAFDVASHPAVVRLMLGAYDLRSELSLPHGDGRELLYTRSKLVIDSAAAGLSGPIDSPWRAVADTAGLRADTLASRTLGFTAKVCLHHDQLAVVHDALRPTDAEAAWARGLLARAEALAAGSTITADGELIDVPLINRARQILRGVGQR